jgi:DUF971 family protein
MKLPAPIQIKQINLSELSLRWSDGHSGVVTMKTLRDGCPCAACKGETVLFQTYTPMEPDVLTPGRYDLKGVETVGGYALKFVWGDGHDMGLYTWEHLRSLCECVDCSVRGKS